MDLNKLVKASDSLKLLGKVNQHVEGNKFHTFTHILYDIRTVLGEEPKIYTEIGSYVGSSAALLLQHPLPTSIICIDPLNLPSRHYGVSKPQQQVLEDNLNRVNKHNRNIKIYKKYSTDQRFLSFLRETGYKTDILFIDGEHKRETVIADFKNYHEFVNAGGYIIFDDYNDLKYCPQVHGAVDSIVQMIKAQNLPYEIIGALPNVQGATPQLSPDNKSNEFVLKKL